MVIRAIGQSMPNYTTAELTALVAEYGPTGTTEPNAIAVGALAFDTDLAVLVYFDGTAFVAV